MVLNDVRVERKATILYIFTHESVFHKALNTHDSRRTPAWNRILFRRISLSHQASALKQFTKKCFCSKKAGAGRTEEGC